VRGVTRAHVVEERHRRRVSRCDTYCRSEARKPGAEPWRQRYTSSASRNKIWCYHQKWLLSSCRLCQKVLRTVAILLIYSAVILWHQSFWLKVMWIYEYEYGDILKHFLWLGQCRSVEIVCSVWNFFVFVVLEYFKCLWTVIPLKSKQERDISSASVLNSCASRIFYANSDDSFHFCIDECQSSSSPSVEFCSRICPGDVMS